ncbi:hypothetical protein [Conexibacter sp. DBS9H8]|uniref:hypothetical protein n=1 Tax=Conexibacter sp. DBS9H8 TaxID=2937801 RepID=UPI00200EF3DA|nr:hypothetical protein [Conexibacter sp. DBS9H8]
MSEVRTRPVASRLPETDFARLRQAAERHASTPSAIVAKIIRERLDGVDASDQIDVRVPATR